MTEQVQERERLLVVEDDDDIREQMRWAFAKRYHVLEAGSRQEAVDVVQLHRPGLVTLDLGLPPHVDDATEGLSTLGALLDADPSIKVVVVTGNSDRTNALKAVRSGAYDYIQKPIQLDVLRVVLERACYLRELDRDLQEKPRGGETEACEEIIGISLPMQRVFTVLSRVATCDLPVLLTGESGTGKGLIARAIHRKSVRRDGPFVAINCGAIPETLLESELFGHEKGAYTGAHVQRKGRIELADGGTLFLDEIGDLPLPLQVKLLHVLQDQQIVRVGGRDEIAVNARVVAATNRDLTKAIKEGRFREDLFYRLQVVSIEVPPLRERVGDVPLIAEGLLQRFAAESGKKLSGFTRRAVLALDEYDWPGNVRELENRIKRAVVMAEGPRVTPEDLELTGTGPVSETRTLRALRETVEKDAIQRELAKCHGNVTKTAVRLGVSRPTLHELLSRYGIQR